MKYLIGNSAMKKQSRVRGSKTNHVVREGPSEEVTFE